MSPFPIDHQVQVGGINLVVYFVPTVLQENVGLTRNLSLLLGGVIQCMFVIGSFVPALLVDRIGRRAPMMWGSAGLGISMLLIAVLLSFKGTSVQQATSSASVAFFFTYMLVGTAADRSTCTRLTPAIDIRRLGQLHSLGLRARNSTAACTREGYCSRHLFKLALGKAVTSPAITESPN